MVFVDMHAERGRGGQRRITYVLGEVETRAIVEYTYTTDIIDVSLAPDPMDLFVKPPVFIDGQERLEAKRIMRASAGAGGEVLGTWEYLQIFVTKRAPVPIDEIPPLPMSYRKGVENDYWLCVTADQRTVY